MANNRVLGVQLLRAKLAKLPKAVQEEVQVALTKSAEAIAAQQRSMVPVANGTLRDSIRVEPFTKGGIGALIHAGGPTTTKPVRAGQSATYDYALAQELGTQDQLAQPFFYPGFRRKKSAAKGRASRAVKKAVEKAMK